MQGMWTTVSTGAGLIGASRAAMASFLVALLYGVALFIPGTLRVPPAPRRRAGVSVISLAIVILGGYLTSCATQSARNLEMTVAFRTLHVQRDYEITCRWDVSKMDPEQWQLAHDNLVDGTDGALQWHNTLDDALHARSGVEVPCDASPSVDMSALRRHIHVLEIWKVGARILEVLGLLGIVVCLAAGWGREAKLAAAATAG